MKYLWGIPRVVAALQPWEMDNKSGQTLKGLAAHMLTLSGFNEISVGYPQGCRCAPTLG